MVKIEKISNGCIAKIAGKQVFESQLTSLYAIDKLEVEGGEVMYSINEQEIKYKSAEGFEGCLSGAKKVVEDEEKTIEEFSKEVSETAEKLIKELEPKIEAELPKEPVKHIPKAKPVVETTAKPAAKPTRSTAKPVKTT